MQVNQPLPKDERGMALLVAILSLLGLAGLALAASFTTVLEKNVTVTERQSATALYAADSGVEAVRQLVSTYAQGKLDSLTEIHTGTGMVITEPEEFFPANGIDFNSESDPAFTTHTTFTFEDSTVEVTTQIYTYHYQTASVGGVTGAERRVVSEGRLLVSASRGSFTDYLMFTDTHLTPTGGAIWFNSTGTFDGRVHTNTEFRFASYPTFHDLVTSVDDKAWFYNNDHAKELNSDHNGTIDVPNFHGGFQRGSPEIELPPNSYSQQRAALGGNIADTNPMSNSDIRAALGIAPGTTAPPAGVYVVSAAGAMKGGIYVQGNANGMEMYLSGGKQVYKITDSNNKVTTLTVDATLNTTTVVGPTGATSTLLGQPRGISYVNGSVKAIKGPARSGSTIPPAIAANNQHSVVATGDIVIQRDLMYENYGSNSVFGLFSSGGNVRIGTSAPNDVHVDAFVMASASKKVFMVDNHDTGSYRGVVNLRGGMVTNYYGAFGTFGSNSSTGYGRNFSYDNRGLMPPYYPLTQRFSPNEPEPQVLAWRVEE